MCRNIGSTEEVRDYFRKFVSCCGSINPLFGILAKHARRASARRDRLFVRMSTPFVTTERWNVPVPRFKGTSHASAPPPRPNEQCSTNNVTSAKRLAWWIGISRRARIVIHSEFCTLKISWIWCNKIIVNKKKFNGQERGCGKRIRNVDDTMKFM